MRHEKRQEAYQEVISMEEYLCKRKEVKEREKYRDKRQDKSPVLDWAELYI